MSKDVVAFVIGIHEVKKGTGGKIKVIVSRAWESEKRNRLVKEGKS